MLRVKNLGKKNINMAKSILLHTQKSISIAQTFGDFCNIDGEHICSALFQVYLGKVGNHFQV